MACNSWVLIILAVFPTFEKTPEDVTVRAGTTARLECAAKGFPTPQIAWQKDGGSDFPAARERRMHVYRDDDQLDDVFFIVNVKAADQGLYSCTATNDAGTAVANASVNVLGMLSSIVTKSCSTNFFLKMVVKYQSE